MALENDIKNAPDTEKEGITAVKEDGEETKLKALTRSDETTVNVSDCETGDGYEKAETETQEKIRENTNDKEEAKSKDSTSEDKSKDSTNEDDKSKDSTSEDDISKEHKSKDEKDNEDKDGSLSQEYGFTVKIRPPTGDHFEIQVSSMELVYEIHQLLMDREDTCHRTCFSLHLNGQTLDNFAELKNVEGLKEGSVIKVQEDPYTVREARIHVRHVRDLLKSLDPVDAYNGADCASLTFLNVVTQGDILEKKRTPVESVDCTPPVYILPGCKDRPLVPLQPFAKEQKTPQCLK
ncbi:hypothetical protein OTU49_011169, partial [Cherax quadricarinatus]